jgi:hypothetical protein
MLAPRHHRGKSDGFRDDTHDGYDDIVGPFPRCREGILSSVRSKVLSHGVIAPGNRVVCILTAHLLKDPDATTGYHDGGGSKANLPVAIAPPQFSRRRRPGRQLQAQVRQLPPPSTSPIGGP